MWNLDLQWLLISLLFPGSAQALGPHAFCSGCHLVAVPASPGLVGLKAVMAAGVGLGSCQWLHTGQKETGASVQE